MLYSWDMTCSWFKIQTKGFKDIFSVKIKNKKEMSLVTLMQNPLKIQTKKEKKF